MIAGIGTDLCDIRRIEALLEKFGERFTKKTFTKGERKYAESKTGQGSTYAKRFAAKEACSKALGTGIRRGVFWHDMGVVNLPGGKPTMQLTGGAHERLIELMPEGKEPVIHLTITDDYPLAQAFVIIEAL